MQDIFDQEPISVYTSEQAIEDGFLVRPFPKRFPWLLLTASVHDAIESHDDRRTYEEKAVPLMMDAAAIAKADPAGSPWLGGMAGNVTGGPVWIALNEHGGLTLMRPEDY
ncbi:MAG: hypothetical protein IH945_02110 [Armatimonadetes bacterium]|nr:hypothetical protein [Armatimonadota bacterium]